MFGWGPVRSECGAISATRPMFRCAICVAPTARDKTITWRRLMRTPLCVLACVEASAVIPAPIRSPLRVCADREDLAGRVGYAHWVAKSGDLDAAVARVRAVWNEARDRSSTMLSYFGKPSCRTVWSTAIGEFVGVAARGVSGASQARRCGPRWVGASLALAPAARSDAGGCRASFGRGDRICNARCSLTPMLHFGLRGAEAIMASLARPMDPAWD